MTLNWDRRSSLLQCLDALCLPNSTAIDTASRVDTFPATCVKVRSPLPPG